MKGGSVAAFLICEGTTLSFVMLGPVPSICCRLVFWNVADVRDKPEDDGEWNCAPYCAASSVILASE
ncbi:hypothetical protein J2X71_005752 [Rhizobium sp. 1399]|jgi:hypothetical protein|nr:hypothetical protein [Rhizobium sp. 1399]